jgi:transcriptional regulator with XRE-family HTH domain
MTNPKFRTLHHRLRELRQERGLTQDQAAKILHVPRTTISKWEHGKFPLSFHSIETVCNALQIEPGELLVLRDPLRVHHRRRCTVQPPETCPYCTPVP